MDAGQKMIKRDYGVRSRHSTVVYVSGDKQHVRLRRTQRIVYPVEHGALLLDAGKRAEMSAEMKIGNMEKFHRPAPSRCLYSPGVTPSFCLKMREKYIVSL